MAWVITLDFQDGNGARDITQYVDATTFRRQRVWANGLDPASSQLVFLLHRDTTIANLFIATATKDIIVSVTKDAGDYFRGIVQDGFEVGIGVRLNPVAVKCVDRGELLRRKINSTFAWAGFKVCDTVNPTTSIVHELLELAGFTSGDWTLATIDKTIDYFVVVETEDRTYWEVLQTLLFEFGYVFYFDAAGKFRIGDLFPGDTTSTETFDESNLIGELKLSKQQRRYEGVEIEWNEHLTIADQVVFSDTTGGTDSQKAKIAVAAGDYYPQGIDVMTVYSEYAIDGREIIYVGDTSIDWTGTGLTLVEFTNYFRRAYIKIRNETAGALEISKLDVLGDAVVRGDLRITRAEFVTNTQKLQKIKAEYITTTGDATLLSSGVTRFYRYGYIYYSFRSRTMAEPGAIVTVQDPVLGTDNLVRITERTDFDFVGESTYVAIGLAAYTAENVVHMGVADPPAARPADARAANSPTYAEVAVSGYDYGGGTTTPQVPIVSTAANYRLIQVRVQPQLNLTNWDRYEIQVCGDTGGSPTGTWYTLRDDGVDWKGTLGEDTDMQSDTYHHTMIPNAGTSAAPVGRKLWYRVRSITTLAVTSAWSDPVSATTTIISGVELLQGSIAAEKIDAAVLNTLIANIVSYLQISDSIGWLAGNYAAPVNTNQRAYLDKNEIRLQIHNGAAWQDRFVVAATDAADDYVISACPKFTCSVGIGATPTYGLHVGLSIAGDGMMLVQNANSSFNTIVRIRASAAGRQAGLSFGDASADRMYIYRPESSNDLVIYDSTNSKEIWRWIAGGGVTFIGSLYSKSGAAAVIGTYDAYDVRLCAAGFSGSAGRGVHIEYYTGTGTAWYAAVDIDNVSSGYGSLLLMQNGGKVGIGNTSPAGLLDVGSNTYAGTAYININAAAGQQVGLALASAGSTVWYIYRPESSTNLQFFNGTSTVLTLESDGDLLLDGANFKLGGAAGGSDRDVYVYLATDTYLFWDESASTVYLYAAGTLVFQANTMSAGVISGTTATAGNMYQGTSAGAIQRSTSSLRYKTDVRDIRDFARAVYSLRPIVFKSQCEVDDKTIDRFGFAAEEVDALGYPGLINYIEMDGKMVADGVQYTSVIPLAVAAIQDHEARLRKLEGVA